MRKMISTAIVAVFLSAGFASADITNWTGGADSDWFNDANWDNGAPGSTDTAVFDGSTTYQPNIGASATVQALVVTSGNWVFDSAGGTGDLRVDSADNSNPPDEISITGNARVIVNGNLRVAGSYDTTRQFVDGGSTLIVNGENTKASNRDLHMAGTGTFIFNGEYTGTSIPGGAGNSGSYLFNDPTTVSVGSSPVIGAGHSLGGTSPEWRVGQYTDLKIDPNGTLSPGGDGATVANDGYDGGQLIHTVTIRSSSSNRAGVVFDAAGIMLMDIGNAVGDNDQILIGHLTDDFELNGCILALRNTGGIVDGAYTLITETEAGSERYGSFGLVTLNGAPLVDGVDYTIDYNPDDVVINLTGLGVPEPASLALMGLGGLLMLRRRR